MRTFSCINFLCFEVAGQLKLIIFLAMTQQAGYLPQFAAWGTFLILAFGATTKITAVIFQVSFIIRYFIFFINIF